MVVKKLFGSVQGQRHIEKNMPCEDFALAESFVESTVFATADGHGQEISFRSKIGSFFACKSACEVLKECVSVNDLHIFFHKKSAEQIFEHIAQKTVCIWQEKVKEDWETNPLNESEQKVYSKFKEKIDKNVALAYGTTLIAGVQCEKLLLLLQIGDGRCVAFDGDGAVCQPIAWDEDCFLNVTTSLCQDDALAKFRFKIIDLEKTSVLAVFAVSDGVEDAFNTIDDLYEYLGRLLVEVGKRGVEFVEENLNDTLKNLAQRGNKDDSSLSGFVCTDLLDEKTVQKILDNITNYRQCLKLKKELEDCEYEINLSAEPLSVFNKTKKEYEVALKALQNAEENQKTLECEIAQLKEEIFICQNNEGLGLIARIKNNGALKELEKELVERENLLGCVAKEVDSLQEAFEKASKEYFERYEKFEGLKARYKKLLELAEVKAFSGFATSKKI